MASVIKPIKVSDKAEKDIAYKLGVERISFKSVKYVRPFVFRFSFFVYDFYGFMGTVNFFWNLRSLQQFIVLRNFKNNKRTLVRHFNEPQVQGFFSRSK